MKTIIIILALICPSVVLAEGTHTFSQVKSLDVTGSYMDINKIVITKEKITTADSEKEFLCFTIDDKYKITEPKELILLLLAMIDDMKKKMP